jgi:hypothetical protein
MHAYVVAPSSTTPNEKSPRRPSLGSISLARLYTCHQAQAHFDIYIGRHKFRPRKDVHERRLDCCWWKNATHGRTKVNVASLRNSDLSGSATGRTWVLSSFREVQLQAKIAGNRPARPEELRKAITRHNLRPLLYCASRYQIFAVSVLPQLPSTPARITPSSPEFQARPDTAHCVPGGHATLARPDWMR